MCIYYSIQVFNDFIVSPILALECSSFIRLASGGVLMDLKYFSLKHIPDMLNGMRFLLDIRWTTLIPDIDSQSIFNGYICAV